MNNINKLNYDGIEKYYTMVSISALNIYRAACRSGAKAVQPELKHDLYSSGMVALLEAWNRFDINKKASFKTYAFYRVRGAMFDYLRYEDSVPRSVRSKLKKIVFGLNNTISSTVLSQEQVDKAIRQSTALLQFPSTNIMEKAEGDYLGSGATGCELNLPDKNNTQENIESQETISKLFTLCPLTEREVLIIKEYYFNDKNFALIGQEIGITEARVSQLHKSSLLKLRKYV